MTSKQTKSVHIRICALMLDPYDTSPGQRFRLEQWEPYLRERGIAIDHFSFTDDELRSVLYKDSQVGKKLKGLSKAVFRRFKHIITSSKYDVIYLFRAASMIGPAWFEKLLSWKKVPVIFDFDDAIYLVNTSDANKKFGWLKFAGKTAKICRLSDTITVGNSYLAEYASRFNKNVYVIPTSIDTDTYQPVKSNTLNGKVIVGWTGSSTSQYHLEAFEPTLEKLLRNRDDVEIRVISNREPSFKNIPYTWRVWTPKSEIKEISEIEVGIMPTPDDEWSRGKCALKALQYMSLGIPAICSDMGANRDVIDHGKNGYLAADGEQWLEYLNMLIDDRSLRERLGKNARQTVEEGYSMKKCADAFADVVYKTVIR